MKRPALSVIVPNYNHGKYLPACLESILQQSREPDEIIVVDDASTDNSVEIIEAYAQKDSRIRLIRNERNKGVLSTLNRGLGLEEPTLTEADYVHFPAADDVLLPGLLEKSMKLLEQHPQAAFCCAIGDWHEEATGLNWHVGVGMGDQPRYLAPADLVELEKQGRLFVATNTVTVRREAIREAGGYIAELKCHCDWFALHVAGFRHGICFVPEPLARFNILPNSYYKRVRANVGEYRQVLETMLRLLGQPTYADVAARIRESGALFQFGAPMRELLQTTPEYHAYLNLVFLRKNRRHILKLRLKSVIDRFAFLAPLGNLYFRLSGYRAVKKK
jgi:glycosyltransferase involved in cell wall biosynthesis